MILNLDRPFLSHRLPIALAAREAGFDVHLAMAMSDCEAEVRAHGFQVHALPIKRGRTGVFAELRTLAKVFALTQRVRPDILHLVTIKPVLYGGLAARLFGIPTLAAIPGLGSAFLMDGWKGRLMRVVLSAFYRLSVNHDRVQVVVQNPDDAQSAETSFGVPRRRITLVRGSGVDLEAFPRTLEPQSPVTITMASRLLKDKGVWEFIKAAAIVRGQNPTIRFQLAGDPDPGNPSSLTGADLDQIRREGHVDLLGHRSDIPNLFSASHVVVLPSYREGLPKVLIEAAASGRSVVTTDVPGCRDAIAPGTGFLVPPRDAPALVRAIQVLVEDGVLRRQMGEAGRALAEREFDIQRVVEAHLKIYEKLGNYR